MQGHEKFSLNLVIQSLVAVVIKLRIFYLLGLIFSFTHYDSHIMLILCFRILIFFVLLYYSHTLVQALYLGCTCRIRFEDVVVFDLRGVVAPVQAHEKFSLNLVV